MPATAIDIGTYAVKVISADPGKQPNIIRTVETLNPHGIAMPIDDLQIEQVGELVNNIVFDNKIPHADIRLSLPESIVSSKVISIPPLTDAELASAINWHAEQHIPIPKEDLSLQYKVLYRPEKSKQEQMRVLLIGTRKSLVDRFISMFIAMGIEPTLLETHVLSLLRSLDIGADEPPTMVLNIGATNMDVVVIFKGEIQFVFTHSGAGALLTKTLQQTLGLDLQQAEQYKRTYGLDPNQFEGRVRNALIPVINTLTNEIQKAQRYFASQFPQNTLSRIVITGGTSQLPGLVEYLSESLGTEILFSAPFASATGEIPQENQQTYSVCLGLLMRELA